LLRLAVRGGARYAAGAPRLFAAAGEQRQLLREDLALQTAEDVAVVEEELGVPPERAFARWDPRPIAAASIGQVHRAITLDGRAVAVRPGPASASMGEAEGAWRVRRQAIAA